MYILTHLMLATMSLTNKVIKVTQLVLKFNSRSTDFNTALLTKLSEKQDKVGGEHKHLVQNSHVSRNTTSLLFYN